MATGTVNAGPPVPADAGARGEPPDRPVVRRGADRSAFAVTGGVAGLAVVALLVWGSSPAARFLGHGHGAAAPEGIVADLTYCAGWTLMVTAMMLPTAVPLLVAFRRLVAARGDTRSLVAVLAVGYLAVWALAGVIARAADRLGHHLLGGTLAGGVHGAGPHHHAAGRYLAAVLLIGLGAYQLSPLAAACLRACRSVFTFLARHWTGRPDVRRQALRIGAGYGLSCLGCCLPLMALMVAVGMANPAWMLGLGAVMAVEKNGRHGRRLAALTGRVLVGAGIVLALLAA